MSERSPMFLDRAAATTGLALLLSASPVLAGETTPPPPTAPSTGGALGTPVTDDGPGAPSPVAFPGHGVDDRSRHHAGHEGFAAADGRSTRDLRRLPEGWMRDRFGPLPWGFGASAGAPRAEHAPPGGARRVDGHHGVVVPATPQWGPIAPYSV
ncbi:hypothetical protein [Nocardiopsis sp. MG754419]|uniref:hypothetical protein n=1 Tax=Nocardiopsis sp. MG754419 TaxID=2259865 RepID=UPI001BA80DB2|nr:hypothetical protein [Nocardiopsis sp. MG754419]MBR8741734.1 hypothetical protein [Nocardiopsis sp. MG754419]